MIDPQAVTPELLACPFCGATDAGFHLQASETRNLSGEISGYAVECDECAAFGPHRTTKEEAHTAWNTRLASASAPAGWRMVPVEATQFMCEAATDVDIDTITGPPIRLNWEEAAAVYTLMLTAAPQPPVVETAADAFRRGAEAMQRALAVALRDHLNSRGAAIANSTPLPEYRP